MGANKITAAVIALVAVCVASFVAVRQLTKGEKINNPTIIANNEITSQTVNTTAAPTETTAVVTTAATTEEATTMPVMPTTIVSSETTQSSVFTTFEMSTTVPTTLAPLTSAATTLPPITSTTAAPVTKPSSSTDPYIEQAAKENNGFLGYKYNEAGNYYYTNKDPWQRVFGFNAAYDFGAQFVFMFFDTARIKYTYDNRDWMVELWKGQYGGVFIGAEIGVYYKPIDRTVEHYDCVSDDDALYMEMTLYRNGDELLSREYTRYWWCTGFVPGKLKKYSDRSELNLKSRITMENKRMLAAFLKGLDNCQEFKFVKNQNYKVDGLDVFINW